MMIMDLEDIHDLPRSSADLYKPWPFCFENGQKAWALGANSKWRMVTIRNVDVERHGDQSYLVYSAEWVSDGLTMRATFCPLAGDLKPAAIVVEDEES